MRLVSDLIDQNLDVLVIYFFFRVGHNQELLVHGVKHQFVKFEA